MDIPANVPANDAGARFTNLSNARHFMLAGNAYVTFVSMKTGTRFTYRVSQAEPRKGDFRPPPHFVSVLTGPNNSDDYKFFGTIFDRKTFRVSRNAKVAPNTPSVAAFEWVWRHLSEDREAPGCEIHHEGRCGRCGRRLTVPESIATGLGPECARKGAGS